MGTVQERLTEGKALQWRQDYGDWFQASLYRPPLISPDARWIAFSDGAQIIVVDVDQHTQTPLCASSAPWVDWAPTGDALVFAEDGAPGGRARLTVAHVASRQVEVLYELPPGEGGIKHWVWSPDGRSVAFDCCPQEAEAHTLARVQRIEVATRRVEDAGTLERHVARSDSLCWSADGRVLTDREGAVRCADPASLVPRVSPDGTRVAQVVYTGPEGADRLVKVASWEQGKVGRVLWTRSIPQAQVSAVGWSPDGRYLLLDDIELRSPIWRLRADGSGELLEVVDDAYLLGVIRQWQ